MLDDIENFRLKQEKKHLSYSGYSTYVTCPKKYDYQYNQKLRPNTEPFHLVFGSATDVAINELLLLEDDAYDKAILQAKKQLVRLFKEKITYKPEEFDFEIFSDFTLPVLMRKLRRCGWTGNNPATLGETLFQRIQFDEPLSKNQRRALKYLQYYSSLEKIVLMMNAFIDDIVPQIEKVNAVQKRVKRGILDFNADFKGIGQVTVDVKTASRPYESDAIQWSVQLAGYGADKAMYIVFDKNIKKNRTKKCKKCGKNGTGQRHATCDATPEKVRCHGEWLETITPEVVPQILIGTVPPGNRELVETAYQEVEKSIELKCFPRNLTNCQKQFGRPCEFIRLCWEGSMDGLHVKKESEK